MTLNELVGLISTVSISLLIIILLFTRLAWYKSFLALAIYSAVLLVYLVVRQGYVHPGPWFNQAMYSQVANMLDAPLMLCFLSYFSQTAAFRKSILIGAGLFVAFEGVVLLTMGFNSKSVDVITVPGLLIVLVLNLIFFVHYVKLTLVNQKALGKLLMVTSLVLSYVLYVGVFFASQFMNASYKFDLLILYYLIVAGSTIILCAGVLIERRRVRHLAELNKTREELKAIYGEEDTTTALPFEKAVFKFEKGPMY